MKTHGRKWYGGFVLFIYLTKEEKTPRLGYGLRKRMKK